MNDVLTSAQALYREEGLELPAIHSAASLGWVADAGFATRALAWTLYDFNLFLDELVAEDPAPYAAFGFAGHGLVSQAVHLYSVTERTAFLLQLRWGTPLDDADAVRQRYRGLVRTARRFEQRAEALARAGRFPEGRRIVVAQSSFHESGWAWLPRDADRRREVRWQRSRTLAPADAMAELGRLQRGRIAESHPA